MPERVFKPKWELPKGAIKNPYGVDYPGFLTWKNDHNGFFVGAVHYTADPKKRSEEWYRQTTKTFRQDQIEREYEIDFDSRAGQKVFLQLSQNPGRWMIKDINLHELARSSWRIIASLDYGTTNPTAIYFFAIDEYRRFYTVFEFYKPSNVREIAQVLKGTHPDYPHPLWRRCERVVVDGAIFKKDQDTGGEGHDSIGDLLYEQGIYTMERATKDRLAGLERLKDALAPSAFDQRPSLYFCERCKNLWKELNELVYDELPPHLLLNKNQKEDVVAKNDHCFVAGTMVSTPTGDVAIEKLKKGDLVLTRGGPMPVQACGPTEIAQTYTLIFDNGCEITCTGNHPIWTENRGFIRADELRYEDICITNQRKSNSTGSPLGAIQTQNTRILENISSAAQSFLGLASSIFIERFGSLIMGPFQMVTTCTTKTAIPSTTIFQTLNAFLGSIISQNTEKSAATKNAPHGIGTDFYQRSGTAQERGKSGIKSRQRSSGATLKASKKNARFAPQNTKSFLPALQSLGFVLQNAGPRIAETLAPTWLKKNARCVGSRLKQIASTSQKPAENNVAQILERRPAEIAQVYNMTVENFHEYYANGILVSNSYDAVRYALMSIEAPPNNPPEPKPGDGTLGAVEKEMDILDDEEKEVDYL